MVKDLIKVDVNKEDEKTTWNKKWIEGEFAKGRCKSDKKFIKFS